MPNKVYFAQESVTSFGPGGAAASLTTFLMRTVANGAGSVSSVLDRGAGSASPLLRWQAQMRSDTTPTAGVATRFYLVTGQDGTNHDGGFSSLGSATVSTESSFLNATFLGSVIAERGVALNDLIRSGLVECRSRYVMVGMWNAMGVSSSNTTTDSFFRLDPVPDEIQ